MGIYQIDEPGIPRTKLGNLEKQLAGLLADRRRVNGAIQKIRVEIAIEQRKMERREILGEKAA